MNTDAIKTSFAYKAISEYYEGKKAERSGVPYIHHIDEGLCVMNAIDATANAMMAYCIHPILQTDTALEKAMQDPDSLEHRLIRLVAGNSYEVIILAMEYRKAANSYLSRDKPEHLDLNFSPLTEVGQMLVADKVQNRKDFEMYHQDHPRNVELRVYFTNWFSALGISEYKYEKLCALIEEDKKARGVVSP